MNLQRLATEIFKYLNGFSPSFMSNIFEFSENNHNLRSGVSLKYPSVKTVRFGTETISSLAPKIWNIVPDELKSLPSLVQFQDKIKKWIPVKCPCRLCKLYIGQVGFIN